MQAERQGGRFGVKDMSVKCLGGHGTLSCPAVGVKDMFVKCLGGHATLSCPAVAAPWPAYAPGTKRLISNYPGFDPRSREGEGPFFSCFESTLVQNG